MCYIYRHIWSICMYGCMRMHVCMYVCTYVCKYVCLHIMCICSYVYK